MFYERFGVEGRFEGAADALKLCILRPFRPTGRSRVKTTDRELGSGDVKTYVFYERFGVEGRFSFAFVCDRLRFWRDKTTCFTCISASRALREVRFRIHFLWIDSQKLHHSAAKRMVLRGPCSRGARPGWRPGRFGGRGWRPRRRPWNQKELGKTLTDLSTRLPGRGRRI